MHENDFGKDIKAALDDIVDTAPKPPKWKWITSGYAPLRRNEPRPWYRSGGAAFLGAAAVAVLVVGIAAVIGTGLRSTTGADSAAAPGTNSSSPSEPSARSTNSLSGVWVLESYELDGREVLVDLGVNAPAAPWIRFLETYDGVGDTFASADGEGTVGTFTGSTGCNKINHGIDVTYEFSAGFLVLGESVVEAAGCEFPIEEIVLSMLWNTPDGIEVLSDGDTMTWYGSNLHGDTLPLTFRREGEAPEPRTNDPVPTAVEGSLRVFDVDGVEVVIATKAKDGVGDLPLRVEMVEFTGMIIDSGSGPTICMGGVEESLPPQCGGPIADGLEMGDWAEEAQGVRWGDRTVVVSWPAVEGHVRLLDESEAQFREYKFPPTQLPEVCAGIDNYVSIEEIRAYEQTLDDVSGDVYLANDGTLVLQVVGDPQVHRDALASAGRQACVIEVPRNKAEQSRVHEAVASGLTGHFGGWSVSTGAGGRIDIGLAVVDRETVEIIAALVDDRTAIRIIGWGTLLR